MEPFALSADIAKRYGDYIRTAFPIRDVPLSEQFRRKIISEQLLGTGPIVSVQRPFALGKTVAALAAERALHANVAKIFPGWELRAHQVAAFERLSQQGGFRSTIVATGTGSGKTEAFLLPILDYCALHPGPGVKAVIVYPMNALANDQLERLRTYLHGTGITFGRYTGDTPSRDADAHPGVLGANQTYRPNGAIPAEECYSREAIRSRRPNILLTGYRMLEYLLVRREDQAIFRPSGAPSQLRYLVLDEVHTYAGALGAEVACLVRRLRGHIDRYDTALTCVGTSATVGEGQREAVLEFAQRLFAVTFEPDALIQETYAATTAPVGEPVLEAEPLSVAGDDAAALRALDSHPTVGWLRTELVEPQPLTELVTRFAKRVGTEDVDAARRQIEAYLLAGTVARDAGEPLLRPRIHVIHRGLGGATRCVSCRALLANGDAECPTCGGRALPVELCRQCGQDYLRTSIAELAADGEAPSLHTLTHFTMRMEPANELRGATPSTVRLAYRIFEVEREDENEDEPEADRDVEMPARVCADPTCGFVTLRTDDARCGRCDGESIAMLAVSVGEMRGCRACGYRYGLNREPITSLSSSTAIGVSILTWLTLAGLDEDQRKLLIFADSRQDTAYQAGYLEDVTAEYTWRQLTYRIVRGEADGYDFNDFWKHIFAEGRTTYRIFNRENPQQQQRDLRFFLVQEFTREAGRRTSLENLGIIGIDYRELPQVVRQRGFAGFRAACAVREGATLHDEELIEFLAVALDIVRRAGALSDDYAMRWWDDAHELRGLDRFNRRPVAYRRPGAGPQPRSRATLRPLVGPKGRPTALERYATRVGIADAKAAVEAAVQVLEDDGFLSTVTPGGALAHEQARDVLAVNAGVVALIIPPKLWRCGNCQTVNLRNVRGRCVRATCQGATLVEMENADSENFYVSMYRDAEPIRLAAEEHSGQIPGDEREQREHAFRDGRINVLVASPTLELGVDIGTLQTVLLRGLPPSPANYAQRAGRAGRRERIALVNAYAQSLPHDSYFYNHPREMIAGRIPAPHFELENETIVRRHIRSLALEKLEHKLPTYMSAFLDLPSHEGLSPEDYVNAPLVTQLPALAELQQKRSSIVVAVQRAFRGEASFACLSAERIGVVIDDFERDLCVVVSAWHEEIRQIAAEIAAINKLARPSTDEDRRRTQLQRTLGRLTSSFGSRAGRAEGYTLGYLANHGFLPSYAFPGEPATLFSRDLEGGEVTRDPLLALGEFAPQAVVYVDRKKIRCTGINLVRAGLRTEDQHVAPEQYVRCAVCAYHAPAPWIGTCPGCGTQSEAVADNRLDSRAYRGTADSQITAGEERRLRTPFDVSVVRFGDAVSRTTYAYEPMSVSYCRDQGLLAINRGLRQEHAVVSPFTLCATCGDAQPSAVSETDWEKQHLASRKHKPVLFTTHLTYEFASDVLAIALPGADTDTLVTLRHALLAAARVEFQADDGEIDGFEESETPHRPATIVLYETVNGGAGYLRRAAARMPALASRVTRILNHAEPCTRACYQCLLSYYNQRDHERIDKRLVTSIITELAAAPTPDPVMSAPTGPSDSGTVATAILTESPIEVLLDAAMARSLPPYELQGEIVDLETGAVVTRPDMLFHVQRVAVYADGADYHSTPVQVAHDERVRTRARELGYRIVAFPGSRIARDPAGCVADLVRALDGL